MRRDVDLQRKILFYLEEHIPAAGILQDRIKIDGYDYPTVLAHVELLLDDGLIDGKMLYVALGPMDVVVNRLTSRGHDAIAAIRDAKIWAKAKKFVAEQGASLTMGVLVEVAKGEVRKHLGLP